MTPTVSVIIATYNRASLIGETIQRLLSAGVPNLEVVIVDDGSKDNTEAVVSAFGEPVVYVRQQNAGPAKGRNNGFTTSRGRYVVFLDDDDWWHHGAIARLSDVLDAHPELPCVFGDTSMGSPEEGYVSFVDTYGGDAFRSVPGRAVTSGVHVLDQWPFFRVLSHRNVMFLGSLMLRREVFESVGGFDERLRGAADWEFFMRLAATHDVAFRSGEPVAVYLKHSTGMSTDSTHMDTDFGKALANVLLKCDLPADIRTHVSSRLRENRFGLAYQAYDRGDFAAARQMLAQLRRDGQAGAREMAYLALSWMPAPAIRLIRGVKQRLSPAL